MELNFNGRENLYFDIFELRNEIKILKKQKTESDFAENVVYIHNLFRPQRRSMLNNFKESLINDEIAFITEKLTTLLQHLFQFLQNEQKEKFSVEEMSILREIVELAHEYSVEIPQHITELFNIPFDAIYQI